MLVAGKQILSGSVMRELSRVEGERSDKCLEIEQWQSEHILLRALGNWPLSLQVMRQLEEQVEGQGELCQASPHFFPLLFHLSVAKSGLVPQPQTWHVAPWVLLIALDDLKPCIQKAPRCLTEIGSQALSHLCFLDLSAHLEPSIFPVVMSCLQSCLPSFAS